jgi:hypothetical protein
MRGMRQARIYLVRLKRRNRDYVVSRDCSHWTHRPTCSGVSGRHREASASDLADSSGGVRKEPQKSRYGEPSEFMRRIGSRFEAGPSVNLSVRRRILWESPRDEHKPEAEDESPGSWCPTREWPDSILVSYRRLRGAEACRVRANPELGDGVSVKGCVQASLLLPLEC